jgi:hypothetical protein
MIIVKYLRSLNESCAVLLFVLGGLLRIPFEYQHERSYGNLTVPSNRRCHFFSLKR